MQLLLPVALKSDVLTQLHQHMQQKMRNCLALRPNEILAIHFTVFEPSSSGVENMLVMTDVFSKYTLAGSARDQRAETVAQTLVTEWFYKFGIPGHLYSNQGCNF